jgi:transcriptional regulator with XRE-family HTH domain
MAKQGQNEEEAPELKELFAAVGVRVRDLRIKRDMSQKELSARSEIKATYLNEIERLGVNLSLKLLFQLAKALEVQPSDLLPGRDISGDPDIKLGIVRKKLCDLVSSVQALEDRHSELILLIDERTSPHKPL